MKLVSARVTKYRSIEDSGTVAIEPDVTCFVGKNESGKTGFLQALFKSNPVETAAVFDEVVDFPSRLTRERKTAKGTIPVVALTFELEQTDVEEIEANLGVGVLSSTQLGYTRSYGTGGATYVLGVNEPVAVAHLLQGLDLPEGSGASVRAATTIAGLAKALEALEEAPSDATSLLAKVRAWPNQSLSQYIFTAFVQPRLPKFVYFDEYSVMPGKVSIPDLKTRAASDNLERGEQAFLALLDMVGVDLEDFESSENHERLIREIENAGNSISDEVFEYWSQNKDLEVDLKVLPPEDGAEAPFNRGPILHLRVRNLRHRVTVPFSERSRGFVWFFSFLAYFSQLEEEAEQPLILLLDEPGLSLHATAQGDLLRFIDERLAPEHQVLYTTHSPFMIDPARLHRARTVVDVDQVGSKISSDVFLVDDETVFPLQAALGYNLAQTLFVGPDNVLLEGPSDLIYFDVLSETLARDGDAGLDDRWVKVPVGGAGKISTFVSLIGANQLNIAVVMDASTQDAQAVKKLNDAGRLAQGALITVGDILGRANADIEDLFEVHFYLDLVNRAYANELSQPLTEADLSPGDRIVARVNGALKRLGVGSGRLDHYRPAAVLLRNQADLVALIDTDTRQRFQQLFDRLNSLLS